MESIIDVREPAMTSQEASLLTSTTLNSTTMSDRTARLQVSQDESHFVPVGTQCSTCSACAACQRNSRAGRAVLSAPGISLPGVGGLRRR